MEHWYNILRRRKHKNHGQQNNYLRKQVTQDLKNICYFEETKTQNNYLRKREFPQDLMKIDLSF